MTRERRTACPNLSERPPGAVDRAGAAFSRAPAITSTRARAGSSSCAPATASTRARAASSSRAPATASTRARAGSTRVHVVARWIALALLALAARDSVSATPGEPPLETARRLLLEQRLESADRWAALLDAQGPSGTALDTAIARACVRFAARFADRVPAETTFATLERAVRFEPRLVLDDSLGAICERVGEMPQSLAIQYAAASTIAGPGLEARPVLPRSIVDEGKVVTVDVRPIPLHRVPVDRPPGTEGVSGLLQLAVFVDREGKVRHTQVVSSLPGLDRAAGAAVRQWTFTPALRCGEPATFWVPVAMRFVARPR